MQKFTVFLLAFVIAFAAILSLSQPASAGITPQEVDLIEHGKYIATIAGCTHCHTPNKAEFQDPQTLTLEQIQTIAFEEKSALDEDKFMAGGRLFDLGPAGAVYTRNLTSDKDTGIGDWTDEQVKIAVKTGLGKDGKTLFPVMPYHVYNGMADADLDAVIAFLRSVNAVSNKVAQDTVSTDGFPTLAYTQGIIAPDATDKAARGAYLVNNVMGCTDCHTPIDPATGAPIMEKYLAGGQPYEGPWGIVYGGNITPDTKTGIGDWTEEEIKAALLTGTRKDGRRLILMPWFAYSSLTKEDADAITYYLKNELAAVTNEVPATSLNPDFNVISPDARPTEKKSAASPLTLITAGVLVILVVTLSMAFLKRKNR